MHLNDYQQQATQYAAYGNINYPYFALVEEVGEFCGKIAKNMRGDCDVAKTEAAMRKELGDILWNVAEIASIRGWDLSEIAQENLAKLEDRRSRDVIKGSGDER